MKAHREIISLRKDSPSIQSGLVDIQQKLAVAQRNLSRKKKGSANRRKAKAKVAKIISDIQNQRDEFLHQVSKKLVDSADLIVF
jgi:transposase